MSSFASFTSGDRHKANWSNLLNNAPIESQLRDHLVQVYTALSFTLLAATVGVVAHMRYNLGGFLSSVATIMLLVYLAMDSDKGNVSKRMAILAGIGFFKGCSIGPLMAMAIAIDPSIIVTAFLGTTVAFGCFSISALKAPRHQYLALGGMLSSGLSLLMLLGIMNLFFRSSFALTVQLYLGLLIFCGYVLYDTQVISERFRMGDRDFAWHAVELFIDFVGIFVRIVIILMQNSDKSEKNKRRR